MKIVKLKLKKGDWVKVTAGKDRGREGKVERVGMDKILIGGVNQYKKHVKSQGEGKPGEMVTRDRPLPVGNVALVCPKCKQQTRVGYKFINEKKVRICRKCKNEI
ncbi:50S ribosomal protein L24 [Candidatus Amesbacteria bacterium]|nr:50S ribosomal protein L24 [Candidatus Amesbacteria bacterium]MBI2587573.1 50S ribosomal protein L24 [Candidatus Amesbacteria bacterium]